VAPDYAALTYVGHATVLVELAGRRLLTDPLLGPGILHVRRHVPVPPIEQLRGLDAILISHAHRDHLDHGSLRLLAARCPVIVPRGCADLVERGGAVEVTELEPGERVALGDVIVEAVHAEHDGRRNPFGHQLGSLGHLLEGPSNVYFAGDTDLFSGMSELAGRVGVAMLPLWGWGPRVGTGHLDPDRAAEGVARIRPRVAVPIHWGTLGAWSAQRGLDPAAPARAFAKAVSLIAPRSTVRIVMAGERIEL
jgi:L-ascorbate metabolism protein UlaG (beta-lactamase superfamily)